MTPRVVNEYTIAWFIRDLWSAFVNDEELKIGGQLSVTRSGDGRVFQLGTITAIDTDGPYYGIKTDLMEKSGLSIHVKSIRLAKPDEFVEPDNIAVRAIGMFISFALDPERSRTRI